MTTTIDAPHLDTYCRLKPSPIHGVGVFAIKAIPAGTDLFGPDKTILARTSTDYVDGLSPADKALYKDFAILEGAVWLTPPSFNEMTIAWYLNHSKTPNVACQEDYRFVTLRDINPDEELLVDYTTYSDYTGVADE